MPNPLPENILTLQLLIKQLQLIQKIIFLRPLPQKLREFYTWYFWAPFIDIEDVGSGRSQLRTCGHFLLLETSVGGQGGGE